jgi:hypothetical protein
MSGGTLPKTGAGVLTIGGFTVTTADIAVTGLVVLVLGVVLFALSMRGMWRRGKAVNQP